MAVFNSSNHLVVDLLGPRINKLPNLVLVGPLIKILKRRENSRLFGLKTFKKLKYIKRSNYHLHTDTGVGFLTCGVKHRPVAMLIFHLTGGGVTVGEFNG